MDIQSLYPMNINYRYYDLEYFFQCCGDNGFHNAELWLCPQHFLINGQFSENPDKLLRLMDRYEVQIRCITPEQNNPKPNNIAAREPLLIRNTEEYFKRVIDLAERIGCPKVLVTPGWNYYDEEPACARDRSVAMLTRLCDVAAPRGIVLAMETIWKPSSQVACGIPQAKEILQRVDRENFKLTLDLGAMGDAGETIPQWCDAFGADLVHCHFVDGTPTGHMPWGHGARDMAQDLLDFLHGGYQGGFSLEYVHPMSFREPERFLLQSKDRFLNCLAHMAAPAG